jgi:hypothetical protein
MTDARALQTNAMMSPIPFGSRNQIGIGKTGGHLRNRFLHARFRSTIDDDSVASEDKERVIAKPMPPDEAVTKTLLLFM